MTSCDSYVLTLQAGMVGELEKLTEMLGGMNVTDLKQRDAKEIAMAAIVHGNRLLDSINQGSFFEHITVIVYPAQCNRLTIVFVTSRNVCQQNFGRSC